MNLNYSNFEALPPTDVERQNQIEIHQERHIQINKFAKENDLVYAENDYFGCDSYYYSHKEKKLYKVCNHGDSRPKFVVDNDPHVLEFNNLPTIDGYVKPSSWWNQQS